LLCAIRDHVRESDPQLAPKIDDMYLFNKYASAIERYTLLPTKADRAAWLALVERKPGAGGEDRIGEAYRFFRAALVLADDADDDHDLIRIEQARQLRSRRGRWSGRGRLAAVVLRPAGHPWTAARKAGTGTVATARRTGRWARRAHRRDPFPGRGSD